MLIFSTIANLSIGGVMRSHIVAFVSGIGDSVHVLFLSSKLGINRCKILVASSINSNEKLEYIF